MLMLSLCELSGATLCKLFGVSAVPPRCKLIGRVGFLLQLSLGSDKRWAITDMRVVRSLLQEGQQALNDQLQRGVPGGLLVYIDRPFAGLIRFELNAGL